MNTASIFGASAQLNRTKELVERTSYSNQVGDPSEPRAKPLYIAVNMSPANPKVDGFLRKSTQWRDELQALRKIILECDLTEDVKWRHPCYTINQKNVLILGGFKDCCIINFIKGALLKDAEHLLVKAGENTQSSRIIRFTDVGQIAKIEMILKAYIREAVKVETAGLKVKFKKITEFSLPEELQKSFDNSPALKKAFDALTPGRQRAYILFFSAAKQSKTREARIEKYRQHILNGNGIND